MATRLLELSPVTLTFASPVIKMDLEKWVTEQLSQCLGFTVPEDLVEYILSFNNGREFEDYLRNLLNVENPKHKEFISSLIQKKKQLSQIDGGANKSKKKFKPINESSFNQPDKNQASDKSGGKKKTKFINLYSQDGQNKEIILLKGRVHCDCQASKHKLINNCIRCGRIVCQQEGSGPCLFCGNLVCTNEEQQIINSSTKKSTSLLNKLMEQKRPEGWEAALAHRNRLLEFDRTSERRTRVTDDDSDYFSSGSIWLSKTEKAKLEKYEKSIHEKKHASRLNKTFTLDFAGRELIEEKPDTEVDETVLREIYEASTKYESNYFDSNTSDCRKGESGLNIHPGYAGPLLKYVESEDNLVKKKSDVLSADSGMQRMRIQDAHLQQMVDQGLCLSMHQPWASLLTAGIKMHEGRTWYSSHRGRLYIASTAQNPEPQTISSMENTYRVLYPDKVLDFPKHYPTGCLLGSVNVEDVLSQEEYRRIYPEGESESPYVFICTDPMELDIKFPIKGKHKIYKLETNIHRAAAKALLKKL